MFTITKEFRFEAAHRLLDHPKCSRLHGHSYRVIFELGSERLGEGRQKGMVRDYADLSIVKNTIDEQFDHRYLVSDELVRSLDPVWSTLTGADHCVCLPIEKTTAEELARYFYHRFKLEFPEIVSVTVCETEKTSAKYRPWEGDR